IHYVCLADFCALEHDRRDGLAHLPLWDSDGAIDELRWAKEAGLRGFNFPAESGPFESTRSRWGGQAHYHDPVWEPFWAACEDLEMTLATPGGAGTPTALPGGKPIWVLEAQDLGRRPVARMMMAGVFERRAKLRMLTMT